MATTDVTVRMDERLKGKFGYTSEHHVRCELSDHIPNQETIEAMLEAERLSRDPNAKRYTSLSELFEELDSDEV